MIHIEEINDSQKEVWNRYNCTHAHGTVYFDYSFRQAVAKAYHLDSTYLLARQEESVCGIFPLFAVNSPLFGNSHVSLPFCDYGGLLYDSEDAFTALISRAAGLLTESKASLMDLRQTFELPAHPLSDALRKTSLYTAVNTRKVQMFLDLPGSSDDLFKQFPAKLRSQIRKPQKEGCTVQRGGEELLDDFYQTWAVNMRDLGSPVHSKELMASLLSLNPQRGRIFVVYHKAVPVAGALTIGHGTTVVNPWASFNKKYRKMAPNMLLYWDMLRYAVEQGYTRFDFGRSTEGEGTYKFKKQWGAKPSQLYWYTMSKQPIPNEQDDQSDRKKQLFISVWQRLPLPVTKILGPVIRKQISL